MIWNVVSKHEIGDHRAVVFKSDTGDVYDVTMYKRVLVFGKDWHGDLQPGWQLRFVASYKTAESGVVAILESFASWCMEGFSNGAN